MCAAENLCHIGVFADRIKGRAIVISAIDNLVKGSAGQALQNFNLMYGFDETLGLSNSRCFRERLQPLPHIGAWRIFDRLERSCRGIARRDFGA